MKQLLESSLNKLLGLAKIKSKFALAIGLVLATFLYIYYPILFGRPHIKLYGNVVIFVCPAHFQVCEIYLDENIEINENSSIVSASPKNTTDQPIKRRLTIVKDINHISLINTLTENDFKKINAESVNVLFYRYGTAEININQIIIDGKSEDLKLFSDQNLAGTGKEYVDRERIRERIAELLLHYNDGFSNILLTLLTLFFSVLFLNLMFKGAIYYLLPSKYYGKFIFKDNSDTYQEYDFDILKTEFGIKFQEQDNWYRFLQILGPSVGFLLTTSSLIEALNPSIRATQDINRFFNAIQIAMVSTFLGLLIRIVAMFLQKMNNKLLIRFDNWMFEKTHG